MISLLPILAWALAGPLSRLNDLPGNVPLQQPVAARAALSEPAPSPDGTEIVFVAGGDLWTVPSAGGAARLLVAHPATESRPLWSPDGTRVAFGERRPLRARPRHGPGITSDVR
jgi:Tol biopolymer transport system component